MMQQYLGRGYLQISRVSLLGRCETKFMEAVEGRPFPNKAMKIGAKMHEKLVQNLPKATSEDIIKDIKTKKENFGIRELPVTDNLLRLKGRIDQIDFTGETIEGKRAGIIIDDKYSKITYAEIPLDYRLQLAAYAVTIEHSEKYGSLCKAVGARLIIRERYSHSILKQFDMERGDLYQSMSNVPYAADAAWNLFEHNKQAEHRRFDVSSGEWVGCWCETGT